MAKVSKVFLAKYSGKCPKCNQSWIANKDYLNYVDGVLQHVNCQNRPTTRVIKEAQTYTTSLNNRNTPLPVSEIDVDLLDAALETETTEQAKNDFVPSKYQQAFFDELLAVVSDNSPYLHIVVEAVAGSGKTTTLIQGIARLREQMKDLEICIVAFNKHIAKEFQNKLTSMLGGVHGVEASTKHSLGLKAIRRNFPKVEVDSTGEKLSDIFETIWPVTKQALDSGLIDRQQRKLNFQKRLAARSIVSICKSILCNVENSNEVLEAIDKYNIDVDLDWIDEIVRELPNIFEQCKSNANLVDFDDMGWLPIVLNLPVNQFDVLLIDEAQDMSKGDMEFLFKCIKPTGHIVAVGDRNQSLYAFRGADSQAIPNIIEMLNAKVLPLSVTYRCPTSHVDLAKQLVPQLEARDNAPPGEVKELDYYKLVAQVQPGDMVICRSNAPLIRPAFECIRAGKKAIIRGRDIGSSLINLIERFETNDLGQFEVSLAEYFNHEYDKLMNRGKEMQALMLQDKVETLRFIINECSTVADLQSKIDLLFSDNNIGVVFSSVHRAKGLEAENVYILKSELMPHPRAKREDELQQEMNARYVSLTRSKENLVFVRGGENV